MAVPARLTRKLREVLGTEAGEDLMTLIDELHSQRNDLAEFREQILAAVQRSERALVDRIQGVEVNLTERIGGVEVRLTERMGKLEAGVSERIGNVKADLMKWSFLFWVGAVGAIAMLAGVLGR